MKTLILAASAGIALASFSGAAMAACTAPPSTLVIDLTGKLKGSTVCVGSPGNWKSQEYHQDGGVLIDYKKGPTDKVDPSEPVGKWAVGKRGRASIVTYDYGTGGTYTYTVFDNGGGNYSFCSPGPEIPATIKPNQGPC